MVLTIATFRVCWKDLVVDGIQGRSSLLGAQSESSDGRADLDAESSSGMSLEGKGERGRKSFLLV